MSNDEALLVENAEAGCIDEARAAGIELLLPREVPLGGPRAIPVLRSLPNKHRHTIGACASPTPTAPPTFRADRAWMCPRTRTRGSRRSRGWSRARWPTPTRPAPATQCGRVA